MHKLFAVAVLCVIPALAAGADYSSRHEARDQARMARQERKADAKARESYHRELRNQRHQAAIQRSRDHKAYAKEMSRSHR